MMRSLYSGVAGLKTHQTKMDVIGNNIANVNTVGFKASSVNFSDVLYQTTQQASGANENTGITGTNAKQIGIGTKVSSITTSVATTGGTQATDNALDCMINGDAFFIVNYGGMNYFTKSGSFFVDGVGTLCTATGAAVMGWQVNEDGTDITRDAVSKLNVMNAENMTSEPEATTNCYVTGNVDASDTDLISDDGVAMQVNFFDKLGNSYTMKLSMKSVVGDDGNVTDGNYTVEVSDIYNSDGNSIFYTIDEQTGDKVTTGDFVFSFGGKEYTPSIDPDTNELVLTGDKVDLIFSTETGKFTSIGEVNDGNEANSLDFSFTTWKGSTDSIPFETVNIDFSTLTQFASNGKCAFEGHRGKLDGSGMGAGRSMGEMTGLSIDTSGKIYGSYDNGTTKLLGQIAVTTFANATGLESVGNSMFKETSNSGEFDGIGKDVTESGGSLSTGVLEMSNVDLSAEFTNMITTQRGFQANSRIITTSDTMLEELINLKR